MDSTSTLDEKRYEITKCIQDVQESIHQNKKEQAELLTMMDETIDLKNRFRETHENIVNCCQGTDFGRKAAELQAEREIFYQELMRDLEDKSEEKKAELRTLIDEEKKYECELQNLRRG